MNDKDTDRPLSEAELAKLRGIADAWDTVYKGAAVLCAIGRFVKWVAGLGAAIAAIYAGFHFKGH